MKAIFSLLLSCVFVMASTVGLASDGVTTKAASFDKVEKTCVDVVDTMEVEYTVLEAVSNETYDYHVPLVDSDVAFISKDGTVNKYEATITNRKLVYLQHDTYMCAKMYHYDGLNYNSDTTFPYTPLGISYNAKRCRC